ncbi:MAG TPA: cyclic nucleotide-binding domain-containing protein [Candidatus Limnocylindria bacterium]|nr:cyclic nucleotide-binding domain-containing protein [Candidatus Limnocylindria bacterium]
MTDALDFGPFQALSAETRGRLLGGSRRVSFAPGATLLREGEPPDAVLAVVGGRLKVRQGDPPIVLATPSAPAVVGEMAVLSRGPRNATVTAMTHVRAYRIPVEIFTEVVAAEPAFAKSLASFAAIRSGNNFLRRSSPFAELPSATIEALAAKLEAATFAPGDVLMTEGERGDDAYLLRSGEVEVLRAQRVLATLGPGAFVGEVSALTGSPRTATVRAKSEVAAFRLRGEDVRPIVKKHQDLVGQLEGMMQSRHIPHRSTEAVVSPAPDDPSAALLRDAAGSTYLRVTKEALAIYQDIDGERTLRDLAIRHFERTGALDPAGVFATVATLQAAGLVSAPRVASDAPDARILKILDLVLAPRLELRSADRLATVLHRAVGWAFTTPGAIVAVVLGILGIAGLATVFRQASPGDFGLAGLVVAFGGLLVAGIGHELSHAIATKAEGRRVGKAGIGLLWFTPVVYVDTSDAWLIPARRRIRVNAAGPLFNLALAGVCGLLALVLQGRPQDLAVWLGAASLVSVAFNLSPLLEFDGYYVLEDLTNVNGLRRKSLRFVFGEMFTRTRRPLTRLERGFLLYALAAVLYVAVMSIVVLTGIPALVNGVFGGRLPPELLPVVGLALALGIAALQLSPFVTEVLAARAATD